MYTRNHVSEGPLHNIVVVDLTRQLAGPQATRVLADMGAKVIKVEQEGSTGDIMSRSKVAFAWISNNKERVSMDLRSEDGKRQLEMLLKDADVLVENFKAGVIGGDMNISLPTFIQINVTNNEKYSTLTEMRAGFVQGVKNTAHYGATVVGLHAKATDNSTDATDLDATTVEPSINAANNDLAGGNMVNPPVPVPPAAAGAAVGVAGAAAASEAAAKNLDAAAAAASKSAKEAAQKAVSEQASGAVSTAAKEAAEEAAANARKAADAASQAQDAAQKQVDAIDDAIFQPDTDSIIVADTFDDTIDAAGDAATDGATDAAGDGATDAAGDGATDAAGDAAGDVVDTAEELSTAALEEMKKAADEVLESSTEMAKFADLVSDKADQVDDLTSALKFLEDSGADATSIADVSRELTEALNDLSKLADEFSEATWTSSIPDSVGLGSAMWGGNFGSPTDYLQWVVFGGVPEVVGWYKYDYGDGSWDGERDTSGFSTTYQAGDTNPSTGQTAYLEDAEGRTEIGTDSDGNPLYWE